MAMDDNSEIHSSWSGGAEEVEDDDDNNNNNNNNKNNNNNNNNNSNNNNNHNNNSNNNNNHNNNNPSFRKFMLYETRSNFYMVGWDKSRTIWRVLKVDRLEPSELNIIEDSTTYSEVECCDLLTRINDGNKSTGGLKFVTSCYGIVGFVKFLGPHYMLLITNRRKIGVICGHAVYAITKSKMIPVPNATVQSNVVYSKHENRYKKLLRSVDLTKNFFFSYSYHVMNNFQKNVSNQEAGQLIYENMFVWNEFMTRGIRSQLKGSLWTVALVYGFFKQVKLSTSGRDFKLTIIARRSRHYAGTRYLKRGVNEKGRVANDVETEQIIFEDVPEGGANQISSVVQNRGSIPLFWSQETSRLNIKPDIILSKKDQNYEATRLHFQNLIKRYGNPIIILNLIKAHEKKPRESILHTEFCKVIDLINTELSEENCLKFLHWDLNKFSKNKKTNVLEILIKIADFALNFTGFFCGQVTSNIMNVSVFKSSDGDDFGQQTEDSIDLKVEACNSMHDANENLLHILTFQKGVLRTNCVDCLDRTNVAQYAYGLVALGHQLHALGLTNTSAIDLDSPLAENLMSMYEMMGDMLALQYGGSAAHNKIFSRRRGQWEAATQSQEFLRIIHRYYSNAYMDAEKQDAINLFLGHFQPHHGKPELWELDSDQHHNVGIGDSNLSDKNLGSCFKRSLSDGNILCERNSTIQNRHPATADKQLFPGMHAEQCQVGVTGHWDCFNCSNFLEPDWHSSSGTSCGGETYERSSLISNPSAEKSCDFVANEVKVDAVESESGCSPKINGDLDTFQQSSSDRVAEFPDKFVQWVEKCCMIFGSSSVLPAQE